MKRMLLVLLVIALCIPCGALAEGMLKIVNCQDWVSLRSVPDSGSERLAQVPLGALVTGEYDYGSDFSLCSYEGVSGYIMNKYLEAPALAEQVDGLTIVAERSVDYSSGETMEITSLNASGSELWKHVFQSPYATELDCTDAFVVGTAVEPMVLVHMSGVGLTALDLYTGQERWTLDNETINLGGSLSCAVAEDGTMYIGGYYGPDPVAISVDGEVLWQSSSVYGEGDGYTMDFFWLYDLELVPDGLLATYDMGADEQGTECGGEVLFSLDGELLSYRYLY